MTKIKKDIIKSLAINAKDVGSTEIQIGLLTDKITKLSEHFKNFKKDNKAYAKVKKFTKTRLINPKYKNKKIVLEGGSIDVNGSGYLLTTKQCLLSKVQQRNKGLTESDYYHIFNKYFGIKKIIWLNNGICGDDTHGHIDDIARFVEKNKIFIAKENNKKEKNFKNLNENIKIIKKFKNEENKKIKIIYLPMPKPKFIKGSGHKTKWTSEVG